MDEGSETTVAAYERHIIERPRLTKILDESNARLILLVAPAGYGKTTLARQWLKDKPHVWYQATPASADPVALARGLERLIAPTNSSALSVATVISANPMLAEDPVELADILIERIGSPAPKCVLVIDDCHLIDSSPEAREFLREVGDRLGLRTLLASRSRPAWISARRLAYGEAVEIGSDLLAMTDDEAAQLLRSRRVAADFTSVARGWPVLLGLASSHDDVDLPRGGPPDVIYDFLTEELLRNASPNLGDLLTRLAFAPSLTDTLSAKHPEAYAEAVQLGLVRPEAGDAILHPLLADFLVKRATQRADAGEYFERIVEELFDMNAWDEAFAVVDSTGNHRLLGSLLSHAAFSMLEHGRVQTVEQWLSAARNAGYNGAIADLVEADLASRRGAHAEARRLALGVVDRTSSRSYRCRALTLAARSAYLMESTLEAEQCYRAAMEAADTEAEHREALIGLVISATDGEAESASEALGELRALGSRDPETVLRTATAEMYSLSRWGPISAGLRSAESAYEAVPHCCNPWVESAYFDLYGHLMILSADYVGGLRMEECALQPAKRARFSFGIQQVRLHRAIASAGLGRYAEASRELRAVEVAARRASDAYLLSSCSALRIRLALEQNLFEPALHDARTFLKFDTSGVARGELLALQAILLACARKTEQARDQACAADEASGAIEVRGLSQVARAIAEIATNPQLRSAQLARLLEFSTEYGNFDAVVIGARASAELRAALQAIVGAADSRGVVASRILAASSLSSRSTVRYGGGKELSPREEEVLALLSRGLTNKQIAEVLFISDVTVKVHLRHVYEKLGVTRRTEAVLVARELEDQQAT